MFFHQGYAVLDGLHVRSSFPSVSQRNTLKGEHGNNKRNCRLRLRDKLPTSTYSTGPDGIVQVDPNTTGTKEQTIKRRRRQPEIGSVTHSRVRDHLSFALEKSDNGRTQWRDCVFPARLWRPLLALEGSRCD